MPRSIGKIIKAIWSDKTNSIDFIVEFQPSGKKIQGNCPSGQIDSKTYIPPANLKAKLDEFKNLSVVDPTGRMNVGNLPPEEFLKLKFEISLSSKGIRVILPEVKADSNYYISRIFRK